MPDHQNVGGCYAPVAAMKRPVLLLLILMVGPAVIQCEKPKDKRRYSYPQDQKLSTPKGDPIDSLTYFFPSVLMYGDSAIETELDTFKLEWYSSQLYPSMEKILYNYYQGQDIYRFTWLRSFHEPVFITLYKTDESVWLTVKKLDRQPDFMRMVYVINPFLPGTDKSAFNLEGSKMQHDSIVEPDRHANFLINDMKELTMADWDNFEKLLARCDYWNMTPHVRRLGFDGSQWIIEASSEEKYWLVDRWSPKDRFRECGEYLIKLSGLQEDIY